MKYSIIIPYRNREEHLQILLPRLQEVFQNESYEIIVSEQDNDDNFQIACLEKFHVLPVILVGLSLHKKRHPLDSNQLGVV